MVIFNVVFKSLSISIKLKLHGLPRVIQYYKCNICSSCLLQALSSLPVILQSYQWWFQTEFLKEQCSQWWKMPHWRLKRGKILSFNRMIKLVKSHLLLLRFSGPSVKLLKSNGTLIDILILLSLKQLSYSAIHHNNNLKGKRNQILRRCR